MNTHIEKLLEGVHKVINEKSKYHRDCQKLKKIVEKLQQQNVKAEFILDEGGLLMDGLIPDKVAALIGTAEKGYLSVEITATDKGGHSSTPPAQTGQCPFLLRASGCCGQQCGRWLCPA